MTIESIEVASAIADARARALAADTYQTGPGDPDAATRESLRRLGTASVGAAMSEALLAVSANAYVVPIDPSSLTATAEPFESYEDALAHFVRVHADGAGLLLGRQRDGATLVAIKATQQGWRDWLAAEAVEEREVSDSEGRHVRVDRSYRDLPAYVRVHWSPPRTPARASNVAIGRSAIQAEGERLRADRAGVAEHGYVAWSIGAGWSTARGDSRSCRFASRKLGNGVELLAAGVLPMAAERADGWRLTATGVPQAVVDFPDWLANAMGGRWTKR